MKFFNYALLLCLLLLSFSCKESFLGEEVTNDPLSNFEILWEDLDQGYALFGIKGIDWSNTYDEYRSQVTDQTTDAELWSIFKSMIDPLDDGHVYVCGFEDECHESGSTTRDLAYEEFDLDLIQDKYLEEPLTAVYAYEDELVAYSKIKGKDIGYMYFNDMNNDGDVKDMLAEIGDSKAIIIDLRLNHGGTDSYSFYTAGHFSDSEDELVFTTKKKNGPSHDDFDEVIEHYSTKEGDDQYTQPVVILTDLKTASAAEVFTVIMKNNDHVIQMGTNSNGAISDTGLTRFLPNGWTYGYSTQINLLPDGTSLEGVGCTPDIFVQNTKADILSGNDKVLERAFSYLKDNFGIE